MNEKNESTETKIMFKDYKRQFKNGNMLEKKYNDHMILNCCIIDRCKRNNDLREMDLFLASRKQLIDDKCLPIQFEKVDWCEELYNNNDTNTVSANSIISCFVTPYLLSENSIPPVADWEILKFYHDYVVAKELS